MMIPYVVVRVNNLPLSSLSEITRSTEVESVAEELAVNRAELHASRQNCCDELYRLASIEVNSYRKLIEIKRKIFGLKEIESVITKHRDVFRSFPSLTPWLQRADSILMQEQKLKELFWSELEKARQHAQELSLAPTFLQSLTMTRAQLHELAKTYSQRTCFVEKKALNDEETIYRYLTRAIVKVSPFSAFTSVGFAKLSEKGPPNQSLISNKIIVDRFSLDISTVLKLFENFMIRYRAYWRFRLTENMIANDHDSFLCYLFMDRQESYSYRTTFAKTMIKKQKWLIDGPDEWRNWDEIAARLPKGHDLDALFRKWIQTGFLLFAPRIDDQGDLLAQFLTIAGRVAQKERDAEVVVSIIEEIMKSHAELPSATVQELPSRISEIHDRIEALANNLGCKLIKTSGLVYHDSFLPALPEMPHNEISKFAFQIREFSEYYLHRFHIGYSDELLSLLQNEFVKIPELNVFEFHDLVQRCAKQRHDEGDTKLRETSPILRMFEKIWELRNEDEIVLDPVELGVPRRQAPFCAYGHVVNGEFVLNNIDSGYLRCYSRFFPLTDETDAYESCRSAYAGELDGAYDFYDTFGFNTGRRPKICGKRIWLQLPENRLSGDISISEIRVRWDSDKNLPLFIDQTTGERMELHQTSLFTYELYPKIAEMLLRFGMSDKPCYFAFRYGFHQFAVENAASRLVMIPRVRYRDIILSRKQWWVPKDLLLFRNLDEDIFSYFNRLDNWRRKHGLPQQVFARRHKTDKIIDRDLSNAKKPLFMDFSSPIMSRMIARVFNSTFDMISFEEVLPDINHDKAGYNGNYYANEILFEVK